jgi:hypothetical protein
MNLNNWKTAASQISGIEGAHVKCGKGIWTMDGEPLETGPDGARFAVIMPTARIGIIKWVDSKPAEMRVGLIDDGFVSPESPDDSWSQYTEVLVVFVDEKHKGAIGTFTSSSWGGRFAFLKLLKPFARTGAFPICTLSTQPRNNDVNRNIDPVFAISGWADQSKFAAFSPAPMIAGPDLPTAPIAELIDDDIPF